MSRRTGGPDKAEQNRATLKQLVKLESNKSCADCKRNKHPRWASWNLGIFVCIRCSGIHRGMGTHISKVKSVDLDSWTDEQMASMLKWGNGRANKYWEHKLAEGHVPNEAKIENFIRTKYDSKRWVMDGPMPDPSTLEDGGADDDVPLNVVQQQVKERAVSGRNGQAMPGPPRAQQPQMDLFGDMSEPAAAQPARPNTTEPSMSRPAPPKAPVAPPKQTRPGESLLGMDFFGAASSAPPARPSSTGPSAASGRSDLKQSILSLYASKPAAPPVVQPAANAFSGMSSPPLTSPTTQQPQSNAQALGGLQDAFDSFSFASPPAQAKSTPFSNFSAPSGHSRQASAQQKTSTLSGGSFFDAKPAPPPKQTSPLASPPTQSRQARDSFGADFGDFSSASPITSPAAKSPAPLATSSMGDLFSMDAAPALPAKPANKPPPISAANFSAFNLSQQQAPPPPAPKAAQTTSMSNFASSNVWDSNDAWSTPDPEPPRQTTAAPSVTKAPSPVASFKPTPAVTTSAFDSGWGDAEPAKPPTNNTSTSASGFSVQQDEEFGGWSHASPVATTPGPAKSGGGGASNSDDLFGNVWG